MLTDEFQYYIDHQDDLVSKYNGKYIVLKDCIVIGVYDTEIEAYLVTQKNHELGTFLIMLCTPGTDAYTQSYTSRVAFA